MTQDFVDEFEQALIKEGRPYIICVADSSSPECGFRARVGGLQHISARGYGSRRECLEAMVSMVLKSAENDDQL